MKIKNLATRKAAILAKNNMLEHFPMAAVIHKKNKIYSFGINSSIKTHPWSETIDGCKSYNTMYHAEINALIGIRHRDLKGLEITIIRISKENGSMKLAKPCKNCMKKIIDFGIRTIHYSNEFGNITTVRI